MVAWALWLLGLGSTSAWAQTPANDHKPNTITVVLDNNYPPYIFHDAAGQIQGILKDTWALWEARTGITVKLQAMDWAKAQQFMQAGHADVIDTMFITEARRQSYDFTAPYATLDVPIYFHHSISGIVDAASLKGFAVAVKAGDACIDELHAKGIDTLKTYPSYSAVVAAAASGDVRVFCMDQPPADYLLNQRGISKAFHYSKPLYTGQFHRAVLKGNASMLALVETGFARITETEYQEIDRKWRGTPMNESVRSVYFRYLAYALAAAGLLTLLLGGWNLTLRQRVIGQDIGLDPLAGRTKSRTTGP